MSIASIAVKVAATETGCISVGGVDPDQEFIDVRMNAIKHKILILSGKGGM